METIWRLLAENKSWLFSGILVLPIALFITWLIKRRKNKTTPDSGVSQQIGVNVKGKNITISGNSQTITPGAQPHSTREK